MGTGISRLAAVAIAVVSAAAAGCGSGGQTQRGRSEQAGFAWLNPAPAPAGWPTVPIPSGAAYYVSVMSYDAHGIAAGRVRFPISSELILSCRPGK